MIGCCALLETYFTRGTSYYIFHQSKNKLCISIKINHGSSLTHKIECCWYCLSCLIWLQNFLLTLLSVVCITTGAAGTYYSNMLGLNSRRKLLPLVLRVHSEGQERRKKEKPNLAWWLLDAKTYLMNHVTEKATLQSKILFRLITYSLKPCHFERFWYVFVMGFQVSFSL